MPAAAAAAGAARGVCRVADLYHYTANRDGGAKFVNICRRSALTLLCVSMRVSISFGL